MRQKKPLSRRSDLVTQEIGNEVLIYDLNENKAFNLNETSAVIWQLCDGRRTVSDIAHNMSGKFQTNITEDFVRLALDQLSKDNLLENSAEFSFSLENISRRDVIRKIGFSTLVALPIVSSLIAPTAIDAGSVVCGGTCQCPNSTMSSCSPNVGAATYPFCQNKSPTATCRCRGPFGPDGSGTTATQKLGTCATA